MKPVILLALSSLLLFSCLMKEEKQNKMSSNSRQRALTVAVLPTMEALPLYYAVEIGLDDSLGLPLKIYDTGSFFDTEQLLSEGKVDVGMIDFVRLAYRRSRGEQWQLFATAKGEAGIVANSALRIRKIEQLDERVLAVERFSIMDLLREQAQKEAKLPYDRVLVAQINDYRLRTRMLSESQVDAAILLQPFLEMATLSGQANVLARKIYYSIGFVATDSVLEKQASRIKTLVKVYNVATKMLKEKYQIEILKKIAMRLSYDENVYPWLLAYEYRNLEKPTSYDVKLVSDYFTRRKQSQKGLKGDLYTTKIIP